MEQKIKIKSMHEEVMVEELNFYNQKIQKILQSYFLNYSFVQENQMTNKELNIVIIYMIKSNETNETNKKISTRW